MKRLMFILAIISCTALMMTSCGGAQGTAVFGEQTLSGGSQQDKDNVNIKDISLSKDGANAVITLYFVYGSRENSDEAESKMTSVPLYTVKSYDMPYRLAVSIQNIGYTDYDSNVFKGDDMVYSTFRVPQAGDRPFTLFFQLNQKVSYSVKENDDKLVITLKGAGASNTPKYFVYSNSFDKYADATLPKELMDTFTPSLCDGGNQTVIISEGFKTEDEANTFMNTAQQQLAMVIPGGKMYLARLAKGQLPQYQDTGENMAEKNIELSGGGTMPLPVLIPDGTYLCTSLDGKLILFTKAVPSDSSDDNDSSMVTLWTMDGSGKKTQLTDTEYYPIDCAAFSPDGSKLAFLTLEDDMEVLNLYDMTNKQSRNLNEEGLGSNTSAFTWDSTGKALYAMSGENDNLQPMKYDFMAPENDRISSLEEAKAAADNIAFLNGDVYFNDISENPAGNIYRIKPGQAHETFAGGGSFQISPDGKWMAILEAVTTDGGGDDYDNLKLKDMATGAETMVAAKTMVQDFKWSADSSALYYLKDASGSSQDDENTMMFCTFTPKGGENKEYAKMDVDYIFPQKTQGQIILVGSYDGESGTEYATYSLDLNK